MKHLLTGLALTVLFDAAAIATDASLESVINECESCHGPGGLSVESDIPIIAGQSQVLIEKAHEHFKDLQRPCTQTSYRSGQPDESLTSMCEVSLELDSNTIEALARHYAALKFRPATQPFDANKAVVGAGLHQMYCESCHPNGGSDAGFAGRLSGQWTPYLVRTISQIKRAEVLVPHVMERKLNQFSEEETDALLNFWASQQE